MSGKDRYALGGHSFTYPSGGKPQQQVVLQLSDAYRMSQEHRDNYRREVEHLVGPKREWALAGNNGAVDLAQSALKTSILINVGGFIAIQAAVPLFKLDAGAIQWPLLRTGVWFAAGLAIAWVAHGVGFHALAHGSDQAALNADALTYTLVRQYFPDDPKAPTWAADQLKAEKKARRLRRRFVVLRAIAIVMFWASVALFFVGARAGVCTVVGALPPPVHPADAWPFAAICKPRTLW